MNRIFVSDIDEVTFDNFVRNHEQKSHFLQSSTWGKIMAKGKYTPLFVGLKENKKLVAATLLLKYNLPFGLCYFYAPRGFVIDFNNKELLTDFTSQVKKFVKAQSGIFLRIDPDVIRTDETEVMTTLKNLGYRHFGFNQAFEAEQPRFTFRIKLDKDMDTLFKNMSTTTRQRIKKAEKLNVKVRIGTKDDIETFISLMNETESRKSFFSHQRNYYHYFYDIFNQKENARLFLGSVNPREILRILEEDLMTVKHDLEVLENNDKNKTKSQELSRQKESLEKEVDKYQEYGLEYEDDIIISAHMIVYFGNKAWVLYAGNANILTNTFANYKVYYEHIKFALENGVEIYDQFGTIGPECHDEKLLGLHDFKKKFGGEYTEFIGQFDLVTNQFMYFCFEKLVPIYRKLKRKLVH